MSGIPASDAVIRSTLKPRGKSMSASADSAPPSAGVTEGQRIKVWRLATGSDVIGADYPAGNGKAMASLERRHENYCPRKMGLASSEKGAAKPWRVGLQRL